MAKNFWAFGGGGYDAYGVDTPEEAKAAMDSLIARGHRDVTVSYSATGAIPEQVKHPGSREPQSSILTMWNGGNDDDDDSVMRIWNSAGRRRKK